MSDAKRKIHAKRLIQISALLLIVFSIAAIYLGAADLYRWSWWKGHYDGVYTEGEDSFWSESNVRAYLVLGVFFAATGIIGLVGAAFLWLRGLSAVAEDNRPALRKLLLPMAILGFIPSPGLIVVGFLLLFAFMMYRDERYDFFGLLLEDVTRARGRPAPMGAPTAAPADSRDMYASGYQSQDLYTDDYGQAAYGGGAEAYHGGGSLMDAGVTEPAPEPAPEAAAPGAPMCQSCGRPTEWIEEYGRYYCYDCDLYV